MHSYSLEIMAKSANFGSQDPVTLRGLEGTDRMKVLLTGRTLGMKGSVTVFD